MGLIYTWVALEFDQSTQLCAAAFGKAQAVLSKEALEEKMANITGGDTKLSSRGSRTLSGESIVAAL